MRTRTFFLLRSRVLEVAVPFSVVTLILALLYVSQTSALATNVTTPPSYASPSPASSSTVSSNITADTTWRLADSPVEVATDVTVVGPATLTIEPGVEVRFQQLAGLAVDATGRLVASGTASQPITFTGTTQQPGWWDGVSIVGTFEAPNNSGAALNYVTIQYGAAYGNLYVEYAVVTMTNSSVGNSSADGVYGWYGGLVHITNTAFTSNQGYAVHFIDGSVNPVLERLAAAGNGGDGVAIGDGTLTGRHVWEKAGLPYILTNGATVAGGAILTVEPGVEVQFQQNTGLTVNGKLAAMGTATEPITFTGTTRQPGWWAGLSIVGWLDDPAAASISYVTIEYGAAWGNLYIQEAQAAVSRSTIRYSSADGVYVWYGASGSTIASSQIVSNAGFAVRNVDTERIVLAANNWWGSNTGPVTVDNPACNPGGSGATVSGGVAFAPFLTVQGATPDPLFPSETRILSLTPQRWFAPADGVVRVWVTIGLKDGRGQPLPGWTARLRSTLGEVFDGGATDIQGQSLAYVTSATPGDAELTAVLDSALTCEAARSASARITFTPPAGAPGLLPYEAAPYLNDGLEIDSEPIVQGVPVKLRARFQNPDSFPIVVNATFGIAQLGLGLAFGPVGEVLGKTIPANAEGVVEVTWTPPASGHYCLTLDYSFRAASAVGAAQNLGANSAQRNIGVAPGSRSRLREYDEVRKARTAIHGIEGGHYAVEIGAALVEGEFPALPFAVPSIGVGKIIDFNLETWSKASEALAGAEDPPRQDYDILATPPVFTFTRLQAGPGLPAARADAGNRLVEALLDQTAKLQAALISLDKYDGAAQAVDPYWVAQQGAALDYYKRQSGLAMAVSADRLDAYYQALRSEGYTRLTVTAAAVRSYQQRLRGQGFSAEDVEAARSISMTDQEIEAMRQRRMAAVAEEIAGDQMEAMANLAAALRNVGQAFSSNTPAATSQTRGSQAAPSNLTLVYATNYTFQVGNPLTQTASISLTVRRVDLPPDWMVTVTPISVTLAPGAVTTATVVIEPGSAAVQGARPRVTIEGYAGGKLLGGVALDVMVPKSVAFDGKLRVYVPVALRSSSAGW